MKLETKKDTFKGIKTLPEYYSEYGNPNIENTKGFFYIGRSKNTRVHGQIAIKVGITKNIGTRLHFYKKEMPDFEFLNTWYIKAYKEFERRLVGDNYKSGFSSWRSEWFLGSNGEDEAYKYLVEDIEWRIENTYYFKGKLYYKLHKIN